MYRYVLFDLDGTLSDPKVGICTSVQYALSKMGIEEPDIDKLEPFIGPPLRDSFMEYYDMSPEQAEQAITFYRERFSTVGKFENEIYPGIPELLRDLKKKGRVVAIASSKPTVFVEDILNHFEIRDYFDIVVGSELDGSRDKKEDVLKEVLRQMFPDTEPEYDEVVMVGDRKYDIEGALQLGVMNIGVSYGYGSYEELEEAGADRIVNTVAGLRSTLIPMMGMGSSSYPSRPASGNSYACEKVEGGQTDGQTATKAPVDWKAASKEAGRQSFANMWGFVGPALMYWIGSSAINFMLSFIVITIMGEGAEQRFTPEISYIFWSLGHVLVFLFLIRDFKSVIRANKALTKKTLNGYTDVILLGLSLVLLAVGIVGGNRMLDVMADKAREAAMAAGTVDATAEAVAAYIPPFALGLLFDALLIPIVQGSIFIAICYRRAKKNFRTLPLLLTALLFGFMHTNTGNAFELTVLMGVSIYMYDVTERALYGVVAFVVSSLISYLCKSIEPITGLISTRFLVAICLATGITLIFVVRGRNRNKNAEATTTTEQK